MSGMVKSVYVVLPILASLMMTSIITAKGLTNEEIIARKQANFETVIWPGFQEDCKKELGIASDQFLTGENMMLCKNAQMKWNGNEPFPADSIDLVAGQIGKIEAIKLYMKARLGL
jgi:hypothetical protein